MRILFVAQSASLSGASHSMVDLVRGMLEQGHEALVLLPERGPLEGLLSKHGIEFRHGHARPWINTPSSFRYWRRWWSTRRGAKLAAKALKSERFDLVYTNTITSPFGAYVARDLALPHVWQVRENMPTADEAGPPGAYERAQKVFRELSTLGVGISRHIAEQVESWAGPEKTRLVYIGPFDAEELERPVVRRVESGPPYNLLVVGRINELKRQEFAVRALAILKREGIDAKLTLVGRSYGGRDQFLKALALDLGVGDRLSILDHVDDVRPLYETAHVNINCSEAEPLGRTILEGMAFGCPTVAANGGGPREVITHGVDGMLFDPGNPADLAKCVKAVLNDEALQEDLVGAARSRVLPFFTRSRYVGDMLQVFEEAVKRR